MGNGRTNPGAVSSIFLINMLDDFFAAFMFEIDINIRRRPPDLRNETLKDHRDGFGRSLCNAERIADNRVCRRAAPLTENILLPRKFHNIINSQEIARII